MFSETTMRKKPHAFKAFTGLTVEEFDSLIPGIRKKYLECQLDVADAAERQRSPGGGRKHHLSLPDRLIMTLVYLREYQSYEKIGYMFDLDQSNVQRNIGMILKILADILPTPHKLHKQVLEIKSSKDLEKNFPDNYCVTDATEQRVWRPSDKEEQKKNYSGKHKTHTRKTTEVINGNGMILYSSMSYPGSVHDYAIVKENHPLQCENKITQDLLNSVSNLYDSAYQGIHDAFPQANSIIPCKKYKNKKRTREQIFHNKLLSSVRVRIEHVYSRIKKFNIRRDVFRSRFDKYDGIVQVVNGLINYKNEWARSL